MRATPSTPSDLASPGPSSAIVSFQQFNLGLPPEDAIEMYYNMAITLWMNLMSDLQIVDSGLNKVISPTTGKLTGIDTLVMAGARLRIRF